MSVRLDQVIPWGRSFDEYRRMFDLSPDDLRGRILGCGDGPASFNAEATARGARVTSCDSIYSLDGDVIRRRFDECAGPLMAQVRAAPEHYVWTVHRDPDDLLRNRRHAMETFLADYESRERRGRYLAAELPALPFADGAFDLAVVSHLLFLYSDLLERAFHERSIRELCRVAREVRIFPLVSLDCAPSPHGAGKRWFRSGDPLRRLRVRPRGRSHAAYSCRRIKPQMNANERRSGILRSQISPELSAFICGN